MCACIRWRIKKQRQHFADKCLFSQSHGFSTWASQVAIGVKDPPANAGDWRLGFDPWVGKIPGRRAWQSTSVLLPGKSYGQRSLVDCSPWGGQGLDPTEATWHTCMVFPVVRYRRERWTIKKAGCQRIDAFELWCWRRLLRVPWTARKSNQSILKEISPEYLLEGLVLKLKLQYFGHLMQSRLIGKELDAGKD